MSSSRSHRMTASQSKGTVSPVTLPGQVVPGQDMRPDPVDDDPDDSTSAAHRDETDEPDDDPPP